MAEGHGELIMAMMKHEQSNPRRIQHFLKVWAFTQVLCELEGVDSKTKLVAETAAIVHDIGIKSSLAKYSSAAGKYQEAEGPPAAREMLESVGYGFDVVDRVCYLVGHHHTYENIDGLDYKILVEADFLVNIFEGKMTSEAAQQIRETIFRTRGGKEVFDRQFGV